MVVFLTDIARLCIYRAKVDEAGYACRIRAAGAMFLAAECRESKSASNIRQRIE